ncbi:hypothetical protein RUM43_009109 [Polyplax serrata]|uniref:Piezo non-specific cation channel cap domain-containing protein n=1 Tax=Polyplax serrata TaxID=468196 RepID=A0AAN8PC18_POLSC
MSEVSLRFAVVEKIYVSKEKIFSKNKNDWTLTGGDLHEKECLSYINQTVSVKFGWRVSRVSNNPEMVEVVMGENQVFLPPFTNGERNPKRIELADMLKGANSSKPIVIENILPKFLKITNKGNADAISKLMTGDKENATYRNISISLKTGESIIGTIQEWWEVSEMCDDENYKNILSLLPHNDCNLFLTMFTFNDKAFPATLSFISGKGTIGLYVMWTLFRGFCTGISSKIMFDDMPNFDRILHVQQLILVVVFVYIYVISHPQNCMNLFTIIIK